MIYIHARNSSRKMWIANILRRGKTSRTIMHHSMGVYSFPRASRHSGSSTTLLGSISLCPVAPSTRAFRLSMTAIIICFYLSSSSMPSATSTPRCICPLRLCSHLISVALPGGTEPLIVVSSTPRAFSHVSQIHSSVLATPLSL